MNIEQKNWIRRGICIAGAALIVAGSILIYNLMHQDKKEIQTDNIIERKTIIERKFIPMENIQLVTPSPTLYPLK